MKILLVIDNLGSGGAQNQMTLLATSLNEKGVEVDVFTYFPQDFFSDRLERNSIRHIYVPKKDKVGWNVVRKLSQLMRKERYDVALSFLETPNLYTVIAKRLAGVKTKVVIGERTKTDGTKGLKLRLKKISHRLADWCVANSSHERKYWEKILPSKRKYISTIYNSVDLERFQPKEIEQPFQKKLLVIGSVSPHKNGLCVIDALSKLQDINDVSLDWFGQIVLNIPTRKDYYDRMENSIKQHGIKNMWNWNEPTKDIHKIIPQYDTLILASVTEGLPNVVCEALASGIPVLASNVLDNPILVKDGIRGFTFNPTKPEELSNCIEKLYKLDVKSLKMMRLNARKYAEETFSLMKFTEQYMALFASILKESE